MRRISLSAAVLLAVITAPLSGCATTGGMWASRSQKVEAKYDVARLAESDGQLDKARESYEAIYKTDPSLAQVCHRLGIVHAKQSNFEAAKRYLNEAHKLAPSNPEVLNDLGYACYLSGDLKMAETVFETALKISKDNKRAANNLAMVLGSQGRFDDSFRMFRQVNSEAEAHSNVAYLYAQNGDGKKALEHYSRALTLNPDLKNAANGLLEIAQLQQKMESDRAQIAQQQKQQTQQNPVAQVAAQAPPKVLQQLEAARPVPTPAVKSTPAPVAEPSVASAAQRTRIEDIIEADPPVAKPVVAVRAQRAPSEEITEPATPAPKQAIARRAVQSPIREINEPETAVPAIASGTTARRMPQTTKDDFALPSEEESTQLTPVETSVAEIQKVKSETPANKSNRTENAFADEVEKEAPSAERELPTLEPVESPAVVTRTQSRDVIPAPVPAIDTPTLNNDVEEPATETQAAVIAPAHPAQTSATVAEIVVPEASNVTTVDFVALCPQATDKVKPLLVQLNSQAAGQMKPALHHLGELADEGTSAVPAIQAALKNNDAFVRIHAALALWQIEQNTQDSVPVFMDGMKNSDANVRSFAATAIGMGPQANEFIVPLTTGLCDSNPFVRLHSAETLFKFPGQETVATKSMIDHLSNKDANVRWLATFIMGEALPKSPDAVQALTEALHDSDHRIRTGAAFALGGLGRDAQAALPELQQLSDDKHPEVRKSVQDAIREIEQNSAQANATK
ncbi:MAG: Tetratricopeptide 2 repeat protein [Planctomycetaceae bacterium]|nr:Tetratricopeptide 2 repeat protein [Planctomycetaceae bacterium]